MFCQKCGTQIPEGDHYCPICGEPAGFAPKAPSESDHSAMFTAEDSAKTRFLAALCYFNFIFIIISLLLEPDSKFLRYHINQSLLLTIFSAVCGVAAIIPILGWIACVVGSIASVVFMIMGIVRAINCEAKDLPIIGKYVIVSYN